MLRLNNPYVSVETPCSGSYGGSQMRCTSKIIKRCGCGAVAAMDTLIYLSKYNPRVSLPKYFAIPFPIPQSQYEAWLKDLSKSYFPIVYPFGMNGLALAAGMNIFFRSHKLPFQARWSVPSHELFSRIEEMLTADIPVILAVGGNFPKFWQKNKTSFFYKSSDRFMPAVSTSAHFVTTTGIDNDWLEISSWGSKYYLSREEFISYTRKYSNSLLCNILYIRQK